MLCLRCMRSIFAGTSSRAAPPSISTGLQRTTKSWTQKQVTYQWRSHRSLTLLSRAPIRPTLPTLHPSPSTTSSTQPLLADSPTSAFQTPASPAAQSMQVRGAIRDTFNPSHRVRKRRHGFLSRLKTRTGRRTLKRRLAKKRSTLSH